MAVTMMSVGVFPFMLLYPKLEKRFSNKKVLFFACVLVVGRSLSFALANSLQVAIYMQLLEAAALGLYNPALIRYTASVTPQRLRSSATVSYTHLDVYKRQPQRGLSTKRGRAPGRSCARCPPPYRLRSRRPLRAEIALFLRSLL